MGGEQTGPPSLFISKQVGVGGWVTKFFRPGSSEVVSPAVEGGDSDEREMWRERLEGRYPEALA